MKAKTKFSKKLAALFLALAMSVSMVLPASAGQSMVTGTLTAWINSYDYTCYVYVSSGVYKAYTAYETTADSVKVSLTVHRKKASTGATATCLTPSASSTTKAAVNGTSGSSYIFVSATSTHYIKTLASSVSKTLTAYA